MALTVEIAMSQPAVTGQPCPGTVTVTNTGANTITLQSLSVTEPSGTGGITQPSFLALSVTGTGQPTIAAGVAASYPFSIAPIAPAWAGQNADSTVYRNNTEASEPLRLTATAGGNDAVAVTGVSGTGLLTVGVKAAFRPNAPSPGGALQFNGGLNAVNSL